MDVKSASSKRTFMVVAWLRERDMGPFNFPQNGGQRDGRSVERLEFSKRERRGGQV